MQSIAQELPHHRFHASPNLPTLYYYLGTADWFNSCIHNAPQMEWGGQAYLSARKN
jgi:hypothetical protein